MSNKKERIMDLMRRGIISEDEAVELLEKSSDTIKSDSEETVKEDKKVVYTDKEGYVNHDVDFGESMKNTWDNLFEKGKEVFQGLSKAVDENIDFSKGFPKVKSISKTVEKDIEEEFSAVNLDIKAGKVVVAPGENAHIKIEYKVYGAVENNDVDTYLADKSKLEVVDGRLEITAPVRVSAEVELYLPQKMYDSVTLNVTHGETKVDKLSAKEINANLANGNIEVNESNSEKLGVTTKNGDIKVLDGKTQSLLGNLINGNIRVTSSFENADLSSVNGNILVTEKEGIARQLNAKTVNGDIKLSIPENLGLIGHVKTVLGGYKTRLKLDNPFESGRNGAAVVRSGEETLSFEFETKSGTIWLKDGE